MTRADVGPAVVLGPDGIGPAFTERDLLPDARRRALLDADRRDRNPRRDSRSGVIGDSHPGRERAASALESSALAMKPRTR